MATLAFAGAGWVTAVHGLAAASIEGLTVTQVASRRRRSATHRAARTGATVCDYDELPGPVDAVVVATPPTLHRREAERAVDGGAAVLVETPLAATLDDADALVDLAHRGTVAYGENLAHSPVVAEAVGACRRIGALTHLEVRCAQGRPTSGADRITPAWGGGALLDLGIHALALAVLMAAPARVTSVEAALSSGPDIEVDDDAHLTLTFDTGLRAAVRASWRAAAPTWDAQAASATSAVRLELVPRPTVELNGGPLPLPPAPDGLASDQLHHLGYRDQLIGLTADARAGAAPGVGPVFGRLLLEIVCAAAVAARTGHPEAVPFTGPRDRTPHQLWRP